MASIRITGAISAAALAAAASSADAALFSFASDTASGAWTFTGSGAAFSNATGVLPVTLLIDDHNGALPTLEVSTRFAANITLAHAGSVPVGGGFSHNYLASGNYSFTDIATNQVILTVNFSGQLFTAHGGQSSWFSTAALQGSNNTGSTVLTWSGASLPTYNLLAGPHNGGFAFALATLNTSGAIPYTGQSLGVGLTNNLPNATWFAEASWAATTVPAPAALPLLAAAGLFASRRRRA
ncbi:MAG: hypothetical protein WD749_12005 [Phycisphaerales bacterium]